MVESLGFLLDVIGKDFHTILASIEPQWILDLSVCKGGVHAKSGGNVAVDFPGIGSFRTEFSLILQTLKNCFKVSIDDEWNSELVLPTMESHEGILFKQVDPHSFVVYTIFKVLVPGHFTLKSLEAVQAEVVFVLVLAIAVCE